MDLIAHFNDLKKRKELDKTTFDEADDNLCMLCHAYGNDKRNWNVSCLYDVKEVVPEALDLENHFYLRICKACRGAFLAKLADWRNERIERRSVLKDSDGSDDDFDLEKDIPVRVNGATIMMTENQYEKHRSKNGLDK